MTMSLDEIIEAIKKAAPGATVVDDHPWATDLLHGRTVRLRLGDREVGLQSHCGRRYIERERGNGTVDEPRIPKLIEMAVDRLLGRVKAKNVA